MTKSIARLAGALLALMAPMPLSATAEPIQLKLSFFASEQTNTYRYGIKPFVDAVNAEGKGLVTIEVYANNALGKALAEQPRIVLDGVADIAWVAPGQTPYRFPDNELLEMPGLFGSAREGTLSYTRLIAANLLRGSQEFFVIGAYTSDPTILHTHKPTTSLADLKGQKIRTNNPVEAEALQRLGAIPTILDASKLVDAISKGALDGAALDPNALFDFGVARVATHHYLLRGSVAPLLLLMSRKRFDSLPAAAKALIQKYSGEAAAANWLRWYGEGVTQSLAKIKSDHDRKTVEPSPSDLNAAQAIYRSMIAAWAAKSPRNRELLTALEAELTRIRATP